MSVIEIHSEEAKSHRGETVRLRGHVQAVRNLGNLLFFVLRDRAGCIQVVADAPLAVEQAKMLVAEMPVVLSGEVVAQTKGNGLVEIKLSELLSMTATTEPPPVEIGKQSKMDGLALSTMLDYRPITLRNEKSRAIFKIEAELCAGFREFLGSREFVEIHSPKIVSTGTEGGAQLFSIDYFGRQAYLAQSPQFYKQIMVGVFERVFEIGPVYRAEEHDTTRHLNEYVSMDFEMGFIESEQDLITMQTGLLSFMFQRLKERCPAELAMYGTSVPEFSTIPQVTLAEAITLLKGKLGWKPQSDCKDLDPEAERLLCQHFLQETGCELVYVTHYPRRVRPFYAMPDESAQSSEPLSKSFDLLMGGLEITTGGQRIHKYEQLMQSIQSRGLDSAQFSDYLQCFRYGMPPHGGLAIGLERLAKQLLKLPTVKLASLFPRDINRISP